MPGSRSSLPHKILFRVKYKKPRRSFFVKNKDYYPTQFNTFTYGINLKNISTSVFPGGRIKNMKLNSLEGNILEYTLNKELEVPSINPNNSVDVWIGELNTPVSGGLWLKGDIETSTGDIETYQYDMGVMGSFDVFAGGNNKWGDSLYVKSQNHEQQQRTNFLILLLTFLTALQGIVGLNNVVKWIISIFSWVLIYLGNLLITIGKVF